MDCVAHSGAMRRSRQSRSRLLGVRVLVLCSVAASAACKVDSADTSASENPRASVPYGAEFWRHPRPRNAVTTGGSELDVGEVVERVTHAFVEGPGHEIRTGAGRYAVSLDSGGITVEAPPESSKLGAPAPAPLAFSAVGHLEQEEIPDPWLQSWSVVGNTAQRTLQGTLDGIEHVEARADCVEVTWILERAPATVDDVTLSIVT